MIGGNGFLGKTLKRLEVFKDHDITTLTSEGILERCQGVSSKTRETIDNLSTHFDVVINLSRARERVNYERARESDFFTPFEVITKTADSKTLIINFSTYIQFYEIPITSRQFEYQQSKIELSKQVDLLSRDLGLRKIDLTLFTLYGEDDSLKSMMSRFLKELAGGSQFALSPGQQLISWTYASDIARVLKIILSDESIAGNFRLWPEPPQRLQDTFEYLSKRYNPNMVLDWSAHKYSGHELFQYDANIFPQLFENFRFTEFDTAIDSIMQDYL